MGLTRQLRSRLDHFTPVSRAMVWRRADIWTWRLAVLPRIGVIGQDEIACPIASASASQGRRHATSVQSDLGRDATVEHVQALCAERGTAGRGAHCQRLQAATDCKSPALSIANRDAPRVAGHSPRRVNNIRRERLDVWGDASYDVPPRQTVVALLAQ